MKSRNLLILLVVVVLIALVGTQVPPRETPPAAPTPVETPKSPPVSTLKPDVDPPLPQEKDGLKLVLKKTEEMLYIAELINTSGEDREFHYTNCNQLNSQIFRLKLSNGAVCSTGREGTCHARHLHRTRTVVLKPGESHEMLMNLWFLTEEQMTMLREQPVYLTVEMEERRSNPLLVEI